jgi:predicted acyl esterase
MRAPAPLLALLLGALLLAGCATPGISVDPNVAIDGAKVYDTSRAWSTPLSPGKYDVLEGVQAMVPSVDGVEMAVGVFLPAMEGCDWNASALPDACRLPAVMDAGPYYGPNVDAEKVRPPITEWLVPRGYASVQMSLRGTGESGGCLEFKNPRDAEDISAVLDWIAAQPWSNGHVGMMGRSYDGTSAWAGAASGNPHLKTIVPISGAVDGPYLYYKNGTTETRGLQNGATYFPTYATDAKPPAEWSERLCRGSLEEAHRESAYSALTGDASSAFWQSRDLRPAILEKYNGSVWVIHGLEDWNVNPSQVVPFINDLQDAGIPTRAWLGVWGHAYPDRSDEHRNVRWDWADQVVRWFDFHLKGEGAQPSLHVEVEDNLFVWRVERGYPPRDALMTEFDLGADGLAPAGEGAPGSGWVTQTARYTTTSEPLAAPLRIAGLPQLHVTVTPTTPRGGSLFAELWDVYPDGVSVRLGWAAIDLRHAEGGNGAPATILPGQPVVAKMEFEPVDAFVAEGHRLQLVLHKEGVEDVLQSPSPEPLMVGLGAGVSVLRLPAVERDTSLPPYAPVGPARA